MRTFTPLDSPAWARQSLGHLWTLHGHASAYFASPRMALVQATTRFGRLTMVFYNDSTQRILIRSLAVKYAGTWYQPIYFLGDRIHLWYHQGHHDLPLPRSQSLIAAPYIPADAATERFALFRLPDSWDRWPTHLRVTAKATFVHRRSRSVVVTLTNLA
jgi:hypothetical protein